MGGSSLQNVGHAVAPLQTTQQVPKLFKQEGLLSAAAELASFVTKPIFALAWAGLLCICFSLFPGSLPSKFLSRLLNSIARSGPSVLWRKEVAGAARFGVV